MGGKHYEPRPKQIMPSTIYSDTVGITLLATQNQNVMLKIYPGFWEVSQPNLAAITLGQTPSGHPLVNSRKIVRPELHLDESTPHIHAIAGGQYYF